MVTAMDEVGEVARVALMTLQEGNGAAVTASLAAVDYVAQERLAQLPPCRSAVWEDTLEEVFRPVEKFSWAEVAPKRAEFRARWERMLDDHADHTFEACCSQHRSRLQDQLAVLEAFADGCYTVEPLRAHALTLLGAAPGQATRAATVAANDIVWKLARSRRVLLITRVLPYGACLLLAALLWCALRRWSAPSASRARLNAGGAADAGAASAPTSQPASQRSRRR